jgi:hypothetical protein
MARVGWDPGQIGPARCDDWCCADAWGVACADRPPLLCPPHVDSRAWQRSASATPLALSRAPFFAPQMARECEGGMGHRTAVVHAPEVLHCQEHVHIIAGHGNVGSGSTVRVGCAAWRVHVCVCVCGCVCFRVEHAPNFFCTLLTQPSKIPSSPTAEVSPKRQAVLRRRQPDPLWWIRVPPTALYV